MVRDVIGKSELTYEKICTYSLSAIIGNTFNHDYM